jgi:MFS transporter, DHA1 family, multidrug resistance protein
MPTDIAARTRMSSSTVVLALTLLLGIQPVATDLYLPALPTLTQAFGASMSDAQLTLSALIICLGLGQLACGPLSDRYGRRPVLLCGLALYTAASVLSAIAPSIGWLIAWRALQGLAMAAAITCGRSLIRDLYDPLAGARVMSRALTGLGLIAGLSPLLGGLIVTWFDWRAALLVLAVFGAFTLAFVALRFEETLVQPDAHATRVVPMLRNWAQIVSNPTFRAFTMLSSATYGGLFVLLAGSSFVYIEVLHTSPAVYGAILSSGSFSYIVGTLLCRYLLARRGLRGTVAVGGGLSLLGGLMMAGLALAGVHEVWAIALPQALYAAGHGIHQPCAHAGAIGPFPEKAGTAASLAGFLMVLTAFVVGLWLGRSFDGTVYPLALGVGVFGIAAAAIAWTLVQRHGEARPEPVVQPA